jgi:quercetin dioxygenase-like cupin family protein
LIEHTFRDGARNRLHTHTTDQILIVTAGEGIVATEHEERTVRAGDVAYIPAGERHWHGAKPGMDMTHFAVLGSGKTFIVADDRPAD